LTSKELEFYFGEHEKFRYTGSLRKYPYSFEGRREIPDHIERPEYGETGKVTPAEWEAK